MNSNTQKITSNAQLWTLMGPLLIACTLFIVVLRSVSFNWELSLVAVMGAVICYKWRWRGVAASVALLALVDIHYLRSGNFDEWLWIATLSLAVVCAFVVTALTIEESHHSWDALLGQVETHRHEIANLHDNFQTAHSKLQREKQELNSRLEQVESEVDVRENKLQASERLIAIVRDELTTMHAQQEKLLQELFEARQKGRHDSSVQIIQEVDVSKELILSDLRIKLEVREKELHELNARYEAVSMEHRLAKQQIENDARELSQLKEKHLNVEMHSAKSQADQERHQSIVKELTSHIEMLSMEKKLLESTLSRLQGELEVMVSQKNQQVQFIESHQSTLTSVKAMADRHEADFMAEKQTTQRLKAEFEMRESTLKRQLEDAIKQISAVSQKLSEREQKELDFAAINDRLRSAEVQYRTIQSEKTQLQQQSESLHQQIAQMQQQCETAEIKEAHLCEQIEDLSSRCETLEVLKHRLEETENHYQYAQEQQENLFQEIEQLQAKAQVAELQEKQLNEQLEEALKRSNELDLLRYQLVEVQAKCQAAALQETHLKEQLEDAINRSNELEKLQHKFDEVQNHYNSAKEQLEHYERLKVDYQHLTTQHSEVTARYETLTADKLQLAQEIETSRKTVEGALENDSSVKEVRRLEGLYQQLREQFTQKSKTLDVTRRELFETQEKLLATHKELEEMQLNEGRDLESHLLKMLATASHELEHNEMLHHKESSELHELIGRLVETH